MISSGSESEVTGSDSSALGIIKVYRSQYVPHNVICVAKQSKVNENNSCSGNIVIVPEDNFQIKSVPKSKT